MYILCELSYLGDLLLDSWSSFDHFGDLQVLVGHLIEERIREERVREERAIEKRHERIRETSGWKR